mmetsp:Transcript_7106/g.10596  ORF Transcript_7106/g.10596 Transcript_7106/m.10596 type:complete len:188 (+) Transcript_7106:108-671(+)|eukprot:CAMPEP_0185034482 /NCGR_PEP_ID=MMETSP1103-20130426/24427_1 /TAXON_ID=36769 /ORGANISM="Paraphysomonas bandaiensis, Strain Caron Lab Isolate" /LENGTH=187 /DNA_ID=CAMNT_0027571157 /DNA_START=92 /DNA_END=655 /DNA_ORIENTATION=-
MQVAPIPDELKEDENIILYDDYVNDLEVGVVYNRIDSHMTDLEEDETFVRFRVAFTLVAWVLCLLGIFLIFFGLAETDAFQSQPKILGLAILGGLFQIPILYWVCFMACPSALERHKRHTIAQKRKTRMQAYAESETKVLQEETDEMRRSREAQERIDAFVAEQKRKERLKANPESFASSRSRTTKR